MRPLAYRVKDYGPDSSGRKLLLSNRTHVAYQLVCTLTGVWPTITQGEWMSRAGGGAADSAGYHDRGGAIDIRVWDLTRQELDRWLFAGRQLGVIGWERDAAHGGMEHHAHVLIGGDITAAAGLRWQLQDYAAGGNGLSGSSHGPDYERRPRRIVTRFDYRRAWRRLQELQEQQNGELDMTEQELRRIIRQELERDGGRLWRTETLIRELCRMAGTGPWKILQAARKARHRERAS